MISPTGPNFQKWYGVGLTSIVDAFQLGLGVSSCNDCATCSYYILAFHGNIGSIKNGFSRAPSLCPESGILFSVCNDHTTRDVSGKVFPRVPELTAYWAKRVLTGMVKKQVQTLLGRLKDSNYCGGPQHGV